MKNRTPPNEDDAMPKKIIPLSAIKIDRAKPQEKEFKLYDGGGLFLLITPSGGKLWHLKYRYARWGSWLAGKVYLQAYDAEEQAAKYQ